MIVDIAIVGGGPIGLALARSLAGTGVSVVIVERQDEAALAEPVDDGREIALTHRSVAILRALGVWSLLPPDAIAPLREARVLNGASPYVMRLDPAFGASPDGRPLGLFVANRLLRQALHAVARRDPDLRFLCGATVARVTAERTRIRLALADGRAIEARLAVGADSRLSPTRAAAGIGAEIRRFGQRMVVCRMRHEKPNRGISTAWFDYGRSLSILPLNDDRCSAVLALPDAEAASLMDADADAFSARVTRAFRGLLGTMTRDGMPRTTEVLTSYADRFVGSRLALIGDAAVGMHPVTAHGFNLGLLGQDTLARLLRGAARTGGDPGHAVLLDRYERAHRRATWLPYQATGAIVRLYGETALPARVLRDAGLRIGNTLPLLRRTLMTRMMDA